MADIKDIRNPFISSKGHYRMIEELKKGPATGGQLLERKVSKTIRQLGAIAARVNSIHGIRVRIKGEPSDEKAMWEMVVTDPGCILLKQNLTPVVAAPPPLPVMAKAPAKIGIYIPPEEFPYVRDSTDEGENVFLVGPTGSGKTEMAAHVAKNTKREFFRQNFNGETVVDNLIGYNEIKVGANDIAVSNWHDGIFAQACRKAAKGEKVLYLADEVTSGRPEVLFLFHRVLELKADGSREAEINDEVIKIPPGMLGIMGSSNGFRADESGLYQGTQAMNLAFANRWSGGIFHIDYAPNENEIMINHGVDQRIALALQTMGKQIRETAKAEGLPVVCSTRQLIAIGKKAMKWGCVKSIKYVYLNSLTSDEYNRVVQKVLASMTFPR